MNRGFNLNLARKLSLLVCALAVTPVFLAPFTSKVWLAVLIVGIAGAAHQGWSSNLYCVISDTMPKEAIGSVIGLGGFVCYFTGGFVNGITGNILQKTGSYVLVFAYFSGMYVLSLIAIQLLVPKTNSTKCMSDAASRQISTMNDRLADCAYPWTPDQGDGTFCNPIIHADYSDPDVIRVGEDFFLTASSFNCTPGLPILHSKDLVNWTIVNHAVRNLPHPRYSEFQAGCGIWAPSLRFHAGKFWIFFPMPDEGIYVTTANHPTEKWSEPHRVHEGKGLIDPCPLWDNDGQAYLVHAYARSRSGLKHMLRVRPMAPDGSRLLGEGQIVFHEPTRHPTIEGPKFLRRDGWYYILAPAGGVKTGWQVALRSRNIYGPYEDRIVLQQGNSSVNGPHQGALVDSTGGDWWFVHFQGCRGLLAESRICNRSNGMMAGP